MHMDMIIGIAGGFGNSTALALLKRAIKLPALSQAAGQRTPMQLHSLNPPVRPSSKWALEAIVQCYRAELSGFGIADMLKLNASRRTS